jgi:hypothetical protein
MGRDVKKTFEIDVTICPRCNGPPEPLSYENEIDQRSEDW